MISCHTRGNVSGSHSTGHVVTHAPDPARSVAARGRSVTSCMSMAQPSDTPASRKFWEGRVALVTGAGRGVGRATALELARGGAAVALVARSQDELAETRAEIAR